MVNFKNLKRLATATGLAAVGLIAGQVASNAANGNVYFPATTTTVKTVDFDEATLIFKSNGHTAVRYSLDGGKSWVDVRGLAASDSDVAVDISTLAASKDAKVMIQGLDTGSVANVTSPSSLTLGKEAKIVGLTKLEYNAPKGEIKFAGAPAGFYQFRTATTAVWKAISNTQQTADYLLTATSSVAKLQAKGGTFYLRQQAQEYTGTNAVTDAAITRASKIASVKITAQAKAPTVKVDYVKGVITFPKTTELVIKAGSNYYTSLTSTQSATTLAWASDSAAKMTSLNIMPYIIAGGTNGVSIQARTQATETKKESLVNEITFAPMVVAPATTDISFDYMKEIFTTSDSAIYEYTMVTTDAAVTVPDATSKWTVIKFSTGKTVNLTSAITKIPAGKVGTLFIRKVGVKPVPAKSIAERLPSNWVSYAIPSRPVPVSAAAINFVSESALFSAGTGNLAQFSLDAAFVTSAATTANQTEMTVSAMGIDLNDTANKAKTVYFRVVPTAAVAGTAGTTFKGTVASIVQKLSVPARPSVAKLSYSKATEIFSLTAKKEFVYKLNSVSNAAILATDWVAVTDTNKAFAHPSTAEGVLVFQRTPAINAAGKVKGAFASHIFQLYADKANVKINAVSGSALTEGNIFTSGTAITTNVLTVSSIANTTGTLKFSKAMSADAVKTGTTATATLTLTPSAGYRFNCTNAATALSLFKVDTGSRATAVTKAVFTAPTTTAQGKIVFTLTFTAN